MNFQRINGIYYNLLSTRTSGATANDSVRWNTEGQEGLPEGWTLQVDRKNKVTSWAQLNILVMYQN